MLSSLPLWSQSLPCSPTDTRDGFRTRPRGQDNHAAHDPSPDPIHDPLSIQGFICRFQVWGPDTFEATTRGLTQSTTALKRGMTQTTGPFALMLLHSSGLSHRRSIIHRGRKKKICILFQAWLSAVFSEF